MNLQAESLSNTGMLRKSCQMNFSVRVHSRGWPSIRGPPLQKRLVFPLHFFVALTGWVHGETEGILYTFFSVFAFVNRNSGNLFGSTVQGPAPLTQDEPLAEMHLHALCRYSLSVISVCHQKLWLLHLHAQIEFPESGNTVKGFFFFRHIAWIQHRLFNLVTC